MHKALEILNKRGFLRQCTNLSGLSNYMENKPIVFYVGTDATSTSLHIGHLIPFMAMVHLQNQGHVPIALIGGGTTKIGDPSGKTELRKILSCEEISKNVECIKKQVKSIVSFKDINLLDNSTWLDSLNYIEFLRDIGVHFSVNRMLTFETYKKRLETGLSFIEFNYQLLQAYDFYMLFKNSSCLLQIGGDDQWGNILSGIDLIRRKTGIEAFGLTFPLITKSDGTKMGKSDKGAVYLDENFYSIYDFYQYFRNVSDLDVKRFLYLFTFLDESEIEELTCVTGKGFNKVKEILAFEITKIIHGQDNALKIKEAVTSAFKGEGNKSNIPTYILASEVLQKKLLLVDIMVLSKVVSSKSEAKRLIVSGGLYLNGTVQKELNYFVSRIDFVNDELELRMGKKNFFRIVIK